MKKLVIGSLLLLVVSAYYFLSPKSVKLKSYHSEISGHTLEVWADGEFYSMPGDSYSGSGYLLLKNGSGKVLQTIPVEGAKDVAEPEWTSDKIYIKVLGEFALK